MKNLLLIIATCCLLLVISNTSAQTTNTYSRTMVYNVNNQCSSVPPYMDIYVKTTNCTANPNCTTHPNLSAFFYTSQCTTTIPTTVPSKSFMLAVYDDTTCDAAKAKTVQFYPIDTCVTVSSLLSYKTVGCHTLELYGDDKCKVLAQTIDYTGGNGVCNNGSKFVCNGAAGSAIQKMGMSFMLVGLLIVGLIF